MEFQSEYSVIRCDSSEETYFFEKRDHGLINPLNDIPLFADAEQGILNMIVEIPRETNAKLELRTGDPLAQVIQDKKKGKKRYVHDVFPYKGYIWNYGCFPQTWENPSEVHMETGALGDGDPLDVCEIGSTIAHIGQVHQVKVLGVLGMIDEGEMDWKVLVIRVGDPLAEQVNDVEDLKRMVPGLLHATFSWFRTYKIPDGKPENLFAFRETVQPAHYAMEIVKECHDSWRKVMDGKISSKKVNPVNTTLKNEYSISTEQATKIMKEAMAACADSGIRRSESIHDDQCVPLPDFLAEENRHKRMIGVKHFCMELQRRFPHGSNDLSLLLTEIGVAFKCIRSFLRDMSNADFPALVEFANAQMHASLAASGLCCMVYSTQYMTNMPLESGSDGKYIVVYNPLVGSQGGTMGTIFSVYSRKSNAGDSGDSLDLLSRTGYEQVAAGYCFYASYTSFVLSMGYGTHIFILDAVSGHFVVSNQHVKIPETGPVYSLNCAHLRHMKEAVRQYVEECDEAGANHDIIKYYRYEDNDVANFHRVLTQGGILMKPGPQGNDLAHFLGVAAPLAFLARQAGGRASVGKRQVLELNSWSLEMSVPMFVGSPVDVGRVEELIIGQEDKQDELLVNPETHFRLELED